MLTRSPLLRVRINQNDYTADSWKAYADALAAAKQVVKDPAATAPQVTAALNKLTAAHDGLAKKDSGEKPEPQKPVSRSWAKPEA